MDADSTNLNWPVIWAVVAMLLLVTLLLMLEKTKRLMDEWDDFTHHFIDQKRVDTILMRLAKEFHRAATREAELLHLAALSTSEPDEGLSSDLTEATRLMRKTKDDFWNAHRLAKSRWFAVPKSYKELLPTEK